MQLVTEAAMALLPENRVAYLITRARRRARLLGRRPHPQRRRLTRSPKVRAALPLLLTALVLGGAGTAVILVSVQLAANHQRMIADALTPIGVLLLWTCSAPLILGGLRLLDTTAERPKQHCGQCQFYRPATGDYRRGACGFEAPRRYTTHSDACAHFVYSERAMVRERLSAAPHVLNPAAPSHD
jgi:hypothetical protein